MNSIQIFEKALNIKLSDEQKTILNSKLSTPTLVNACAGAGKTTTMILSILYQQMEGITKTEDVLAITFSKKAQIDMAEKFESLKSKIALVYPEAQNFQEPTFKTFHALFFQILKVMYPNFSWGITSPKHYQYSLYNVLENPDDALTEKENVERYVNLQSSLINQNYSLNGYDVNIENPLAQAIIKNMQNSDKQVPSINTLLNYLGVASPEAIKDYLNIVQQYTSEKINDHSIDFDDMQTIVLTALQKRPEMKTIIRNYMLKYPQIYIDEFQDISPIQWAILRQIISPQALNHLTAIGDDDQSIYSFRGSEPKYILKFKKLVPNAKRFNLSTNYRTKENILNSVIPLIEQNTLRLDKHLKAANPGGIVKQSTRPLTIQDDQALNEFIEDLKQNPQKRFAILARNNADLSIIADYCAENELYANFGESNKNNILQNTKLYSIYQNLIEAIYKDDFAQFIKFSNRIGFTDYKKRLQKFAKNYNSLSAFLNSKDALTQPNKAKGLSDLRRVKTYNDANLQLKRAINIIKSNQKDELASTQKYLLSYLFQTIDSLTAKYFAYMIKNHYLQITENDFNAFRFYFKWILNRSANVNAFLLKEEMKRSSIENQAEIKNYHLQAMTLHRSKGLEFNETLVYTSPKTTFDDPAYKLCQLFPANLKNAKEMQEILENNPLQSAVIMFENQLNSLELLEKHWIPELSSPDEKTRYKAFDKQHAFEMMLKQISNNSFLDIQDININIDFQFLKNDPVLANLVFMEINNRAKELEEQRRLMYVGITRAKDKVLLDTPDDIDKITNEIHWSKNITKEGN